MVKPKGGRGHTAPYEQKHVRVPLPVLEQVNKIIDDYRTVVLTGEKSSETNSPSCAEIESCIKLVNRFLDEEKISQESFDRPTRNNQNLKRFFDWLNELR